MQELLLKPEFPMAEFLPLKGYEISYPLHRNNFKLKIALQTPKILSAIRNEQNWVRKMVERHRIDGIISDNRFGLYHPNVPSVFITHQLRIQTGTGSLADDLVQKLNYSYISHFTTCWVPDYADSPNLAGILSHPEQLPLDTLYIGALSRLEKTASQKRYDLAVVLSGPEPQRSIFEEKILAGLADTQQKWILIRGLPGETSHKTENPNSQVFPHLNTEELGKVLCDSEMVICRSGYSSIMDLVGLEKKAILVPTPGQTEQEYLASYHKGQGIFYSLDQKDFSLGRALEESKRFPFNLPSFDMQLYKKAVRQFVGSL